MHRLVTIHCLVLVLAACAEPRSGGEPTGGGTDAGSQPDGSTAGDGGLSDGGDLAPDGGFTPSRFLARVGPGQLRARPSESVPLKAVLVSPTGATDPDGGGALPQRIAGVGITWSIVEGDSLASLQDTVPLTDQAGLSTTTLVANAGAEGTVKVRAEAPEAGNNAEWTITLGKPARHVRIIPNPPLISLTATDASAAAAIARVGQTLSLDVRVVEDFGEGVVPVEGVTVQFVFVTSIAGASFPGGETRITNHNGRASAELVGGTTVGAYKVLAIIEGNVSAAFNVSVTNTTPSSCTISSQCGNGYLCTGGSCQVASSGCGTSDQLCPVGFECRSGACGAVGRPSCVAVECPHGYFCNAQHMCDLEDPQCTVRADCPSNSTCADGICYWTGGLMLNVTGHWYTAHDFDIHTALPEWLQIGGELAAALDNILAGNIPNLPRAVNVLLQGLVTAYVPAWATEFISFLKDMSDAFGQLHVHGEMDVTAIDSAGDLLLTEEWTTLRFESAAFCPPGTVVDATHQPACSRFDVDTSDLALENIATTVHSATARIVDTQLLVDRRRVDLPLGGILSYALNAVAQRTGYVSLQGPPGHPDHGALYNLIDCAGVGELVLAAGLPIDVTDLCRSFVATAADELAIHFSNIVINTNTLSFLGKATALPQPGSSTYAYRLGQVTYETVNPPDGRWDGRFINLAGDIPGRWRAARQPLE